MTMGVVAFKKENVTDVLTKRLAYNLLAGIYKKNILRFTFNSQLQYPHRTLFLFCFLQAISKDNVVVVPVAILLSFTFFAIGIYK